MMRIRALSDPLVLAATTLAVVLLSGCGNLGGSDRTVYTSETPAEQAAKSYGTGGGLLTGDDGKFSILGGPDEPREGAGAGIGVNSYLWRASLDTISFMPLASADPFGGVIITDWYSPPNQPAERFKVNLYILGRALRADAVRASVFRQTRDGSGSWVDAEVDPKTPTQLENAILTRAREMRIASANQ